MTAPVEHALTVTNASGGPDVLAVGAWFKNTVCALVGDTAYLSPTVGDLDGADACRAHEATVRAYLELFDAAGTRPQAVAHDLHPDFHSSRFAQALADELRVPAIAVQHHHAHLAAVCAEHGQAGAVIGLVLDGVGLGTDGTAWGGELLWVQAHRWERLAGLRPLRLPGADRAAREPWRMAASVLEDLGRGDEIAHRWPQQSAASGLHRMMERGLRSPTTSSMGRVFDAAAGLLSLCTVMTLEAEAAIALEQAAQRHLDRVGPGEVLTGGWTFDDAGRLDLRTVLATLIDVEPGQVDCAAARFHATLGAALADWVTRAATDRGVAVRAIGGGCFFNRILRADLRRRLAGEDGAGPGLLEPTTLLPGDTAIALGQAVVARATLAVQDPASAGDDHAYLGRRPLTEVM